MSEIPNDVVKVDVYSKELPQGVAELSQDAEPTEIQPYIISFAKYKDKLCEISLLNSNKARKAIETLKTIGTKIKSQADFQRHTVDRLPVKNIGDYKKLYNGLSADVEIKEIKLQQDARIFYFDFEPEKTFFVIAITENHLETDKVRR